MFNFRISRIGFTTKPGGLSGSRELLLDPFGINPSFPSCQGYRETSHSPPQILDFPQDLGFMSHFPSSPPALAGFYPCPRVPGHHFSFNLPFFSLGRAAEQSSLCSWKFIPDKFIFRAEPSLGWARGLSCPSSPKKRNHHRRCCTRACFHFDGVIFGSSCLCLGFLSASKAVIGVDLFWSGSWKAGGLFKFPGSAVPEDLLAFQLQLSRLTLEDPTLPLILLGSVVP